MARDQGDPAPHATSRRPRRDIGPGASPVSSPVRRPRRRDRHGRGFRGMLLPPHLPGHLTRREQFDEAVLAAAEPLLDRFGRRLEHLMITVEEVPAGDPAPWEMQSVPLGRLVPADRDHPARVVLYRRPLVTRCTAPGDLEILVRQVLAEQVASMLAMDPEDVDPGAWDV